MTDESIDTIIAVRQDGVSLEQMSAIIAELMQEIIKLNVGIALITDEQGIESINGYAFKGDAREFSRADLEKLTKILTENKETIRSVLRAVPDNRLGPEHEFHGARTAIYTRNPLEHTGGYND